MPVRFLTWAEIVLLAEVHTRSLCLIRARWNEVVQRFSTVGLDTLDPARGLWSNGCYIYCSSFDLAHVQTHSDLHTSLFQL